MNKNDFINEVAKRKGITPRRASREVNDVMDTLRVIADFPVMTRTTVRVFQSKRRGRCLRIIAAPTITRCITSIATTASQARTSTDPVSSR